MGDGRTPVLWLETTNVDFGVPGLDDSKYLSMTIAHAVGRGLHLFIFRLYLSAFCAIASTFRGCLRGVRGY
jgi:hypothetical protein